LAAQRSWSMLRRTAKPSHHGQPLSSNVRHHRATVSDLVALANRKLTLAAEERVRAIPAELKAMKAELAPKGLAKSGAALKRGQALCVRHIKEHGEAVATEYKWAVGQALTASQSWANEVAAGAAAQFEPLLTAARLHLTKLAAFTGRPDLSDRLVSEIESEVRVAEERVKLAVQAAFAERSRGLLRSLLATAGGLLGRLTRPGP